MFNCNQKIISCMIFKDNTAGNADVNKRSVLSYLLYEIKSCRCIATYFCNCIMEIDTYMKASNYHLQTYL